MKDVGKERQQRLRDIEVDEGKNAAEKDRNDT